MGLPAILAFSLVSSAAQTGLALSQKNKTPAPPEPPAEMGNEGAIRAEKEGEMRRRKQGSGGRASTILSGSPLGVPGQANTGRKLLTGY